MTETKKTTLDRTKLYSESQHMRGPLGAIAYGVLKGLQAAGMEEKVLASVRQVIHDGFSKLSDSDCNAICDVVFKRLQEDSKDGKWYG